MAKRDAAGARSVHDLTQIVQAGGRPKFLFFWGHQPRADRQLDAACFSQWWPARFACGGEVFATAEHYMMWRKATLFEDHGRAREIRQAKSPAQAKALGRLVEGFQEGTWAEHRWEIVVTGSTAKFSSDPALRSFLVGTGKRVLVEASPADRVWGIGLSEASEFAEQPQRWKGLNLLGFALMEAREHLSRAGHTEL